jgi:hypothetical protein
MSPWDMLLCGRQAAYLQGFIWALCHTGNSKEAELIRYYISIFLTVFQ